MKIMWLRKKTTTKHYTYFFESVYPNYFFHSVFPAHIEAACHTDWTLFGGKCYRLISTNKGGGKTWTQAKSICTSMLAFII